MSPLPTIAVLLLAMAAAPTQAATYDFSWSSAGTTPGFAANASTVLTIGGSIDIDTAAGSAFDQNDVTRFDIAVTMTSPSFSGDWDEADLLAMSGTIAANGWSVSVDTLN